MQTMLKKVYTILPLVIVIFFFQNCTTDVSAGTAHANYEGIQNIDDFESSSHDDTLQQQKL